MYYAAKWFKYIYKTYILNNQDNRSMYHLVDNSDNLRLSVNPIASDSMHEPNYHCQYTDSSWALVEHLAEAYNVLKNTTKSLEHQKQWAIRLRSASV